MVAADWVTVGIGVTTVALSIEAFCEAIYPPETKKAKVAWTVVAIVLGGAAIVLVFIQVNLAAKDRVAGEQQTQQLARALASINQELTLQAAQSVNPPLNAGQSSISQQELDVTIRLRHRYQIFLNTLATISAKPGSGEWQGQYDKAKEQMAEDYQFDFLRES